MPSVEFCVTTQKEYLWVQDDRRIPGIQKHRGLHVVLVCLVAQDNQHLLSLLEPFQGLVDQGGREDQWDLQI